MTTATPACDRSTCSPPRRLHDLNRHDRRLAIAMLVLVLLPFVVALARAFRDGWVPSGDEANIATRSLDVFSRHPPLTGLPSTSSFYGEQIQTNHPGPIEFYLLAMPLRLFGMSVGSLLTAASINAACVVIAIWVFFRRLGLTAALWAGVLLLAVMWSGGSQVMIDTLSSNMTMYSLLATAVLAWALIDGDLAMLPLAVLVASYAAQQHLAAGLIVLPLVVVATTALALRIVVRVRRGDVEISAVARRWSLVAVGVAAVCWAPVALDEATGHPGNLTQIVRFARDNTRPTLGFKSGVYQAVHAVTPPTILGRTDATGWFFIAAPGWTHLVAGVLVVAGLGALAWKARVRSPGLASLALLALVLLTAGIVNGGNVPMSFEAGRINLYRWTWAAALVTWGALGCGVALLVGQIARRTKGGSSIQRRARRIGAPALVIVAALVSTLNVFVSGTDDHDQLSSTFAAEKKIAAAVLARVDRRRPVLVVEQGNAALLAIGPYLISRMVQAGIDVEVTRFVTGTYGSWRRYHPGSGAAAIVVVSGQATLPSAPGQLLETAPFAPERTALLDELSTVAFGTKVELAPGARELIDREYPGLRGISLLRLLETIPSDPRAGLEQSDFLKLVLRGMVRSPRLDQTKVQRLLDLGSAGTTFARDEQVGVRLVPPDQLQSDAFMRLIAKPYVPH